MAQPPCLKPFIPIVCHRNLFLIILIAYKICVLIEWVKSSQDCSSYAWRREECESRADTALAQRLLYPFPGLAARPHLGGVRFLAHAVHLLGRLWEELSEMLQPPPSLFTDLHLLSFGAPVILSAPWWTPWKTNDSRPHLHETHTV